MSSLSQHSTRETAQFDSSGRPQKSPHAVHGTGIGGKLQSSPLSLAPPAGTQAASQVQSAASGRFARGGSAARAHDVKRLLTAIERSQATKRTAQVARRAARASTLLSPLPSYMEEDAYDLGSKNHVADTSSQKRRPTSAERRADVHSIPPKRDIASLGGRKTPQVDVSLALQWAEQVHPRMQVGDARVPLSVCSTRLGRHCCELCRVRLLDPCKEGVYSDLEVFGPGVSMLFKDLKCLALVFFLLGCVSLPHFMLNMLLGKGVISPAVLLNTRFTDTMLGNLGGQLLNPLTANSTAPAQTNGTNFEVLFGSVGICQAIVPSNVSSNELDTAPWLQETICNLGDSSIALLYTWIDMIVVAVFVAFYFWLRFFQHHEDHLVDRDFATAADFSIYVRGLPAEVDESSIKSHFEVVVGESVAAVSIARDEPEYVRLAARGGALLQEWEEVAAASAKTVLVQAALRSAESSPSDPIAIPTTASDPSTATAGGHSSDAGSAATGSQASASPGPGLVGARSSPVRGAFNFNSQDTESKSGSLLSLSSRMTQAGGSGRSLRPSSPGGRLSAAPSVKGPLRATSPRLERDDIEVAAELITGVRAREMRARVAVGAREAATSVHGAVGLHDKETFAEVDAMETARLQTITGMAATLSGDPLAPVRRRLLLRMRKLYRRILRARSMHVGVLADAVRYVDADQISQADPGLVKAGRMSGWRGMGRPVGAFVTFERQIARRRALKKYANSSWRLSRCMCQPRSMRVAPDVSSRMIMKAVNSLAPAVSDKVRKRGAVPRRPTQWSAIASANEKKAKAQSGAKLSDSSTITPPSSSDEGGASQPGGGSNRAAKMASLAAKQSIRRMRVDSGAGDPPKQSITRKRSGADMRTGSSGGLLSSGVVQVRAVLGGLSSSSEDDSDFDDDIVGVLDVDFDELDFSPQAVKLGGGSKSKKGGTSTSNPLSSLGGGGSSSTRGANRRRSVSLNPLASAITSPTKTNEDRPHSTPHAQAEGGATAETEAAPPSTTTRTRRTSAAMQWTSLAQRRAGTSSRHISMGGGPPPSGPPSTSPPLLSRAPSPEQRQRSDGSVMSDVATSDFSDEDEGGAFAAKGSSSPDQVHRHATSRNRKALRRLSTRWGVDLTASPTKKPMRSVLEGVPSLEQMQKQQQEATRASVSLAGGFAPGASRELSGSKAFGTTRARRRRGGGDAAEEAPTPARERTASDSPEFKPMAPPSLPPPSGAPPPMKQGGGTATKPRYGTGGTTMERQGGRAANVLADEDSSTSAANKVFDFDKEHQRLGLYPVEVLEASPPYFVQWANLQISWWGRLLRGSLTTILLVGGLSFSFGLAAYTNAALADAAGTAQTAVCPVESVELTASLLEQDPRLVPCYCKTLSLLTVLTDPLCDEWKVKAAIGLGVTTVSSVTMAVINALLQVVILLLTPFEAHWSKDSEQISLTWRLFVSLFFNTALIQLLVTADLDYIFNTDLGILSADSGQLFRDLSPGWYQVVGSLLSAVLMFNIVAPHLLPLAQMFVHNLRRKWAIRRPMWECYWPIALCCACDGLCAPCCCGGSNRPVCPGPCGGMCLCSCSCCLFLSTCGCCGQLEDVAAVSRRQAHMASGDAGSPTARGTASPNGKASTAVTVSSRENGEKRGVEMTQAPAHAMHSNSMLQRPASATKAYSVMGALASEASATPEYHLAGMPVRTLDCCPGVGTCAMTCERRWYDWWAPRKQSELNRVYTGDEFPLVQRYSAILTTVFATFMYSSSMPMLYWLASLSFFAFVWLDFTLLVTFYRSPLHFSARPGVALTGLMPLALVLHFVFAAMAYSNEEIFPTSSDESAVQVGGASVPVSRVSELAEARAGSFELLQRLSRPHILPLVVAVLLILLFEVAVRGTVYALNAWRRQGCSLTKTRESQLPPYSQLLKQNKISGITSYNFLESSELAERIHVPDHFTEHFGSITDVLLYQSRRIEQIMQWSGMSLEKSDKAKKGRRRRRMRRQKDDDEEE